MSATYIVPLVGITLMLMGLLGVGAAALRSHRSEARLDFIRSLGTPTILMGFGLPDDNLHAPNEKFHLANFHRGIESIVRFLANVATS